MVSEKCVVEEYKQIIDYWAFEWHEMSNSNNNRFNISEWDKFSSDLNQLGKKYAPNMYIRRYLEELGEITTLLGDKFEYTGHNGPGLIKINNKSIMSINFA